MDRLEEIRIRYGEASDGPWECIETPDYVEIHVQGGKEAGFSPVALADETYNANFISHAREDIPYLLSEVDRLTALHKREIIVTGEYAQHAIDLTARAEAAEARADAAIADLNHLTYEGSKCEICKHYLDENCITCEFEWRGQEAGKGKNDEA